MPGTSLKRQFRPPGVGRGSWTRTRRRLDAQKQRAAWSARRNARVVVPRNKLGFPTSMTCTVRYVERVDFAPVDNKAAAWSFKANGMYDPLVSLGGHKPRGFDEYAALYKTYTVTSSKVAVNFMYEGYDGPSTATVAGSLQKSTIVANDIPALSPAVCGIFKSNELYGSAIPVGEQMERDRTNWTVITPQSGSGSCAQMSDFSEFFGKQDLVASEGYSGTATTDPDNPVYYHIFAARGTDDYAPGTSVCKVCAYVTIEYRATWTDPLALVQS